MLRIVAKYADRWNIPGGYPDIADLTATLKGHCEAVGRDFNQIEISEQLLVCMGASAEEVERKWQAASGCVRSPAPRSRERRPNWWPRCRIASPKG